MNELLFEALLIFLLLVANGIFALAEISIVSSRPARLRVLADEGSAAARAALALAENPTRFLSTVQIGITLIGILAGAFGGARLSGPVASLAAKVPLLAPYSQVIGLVVVVSLITYFSLLIGELVPKRIGLGSPERMALLLAGPMTTLSRPGAPFVWFLTASTHFVLRQLRLDQPAATPPSDEEVTHLLRQGTSAGVFHHAEPAMVEGVLRLDERPVAEIMTRRTHIVWLNAADPDEVNWRKIVASGHSHFPVFEGNRDAVIGLVSVKALWANTAFGLPNRLRDHLTKPLIVPQTMNAVQLLDTFKRTGRHLALVADEFGSIQGLVTLIDVMEAIVGHVPGPGDRRMPEAIQRDDGSWLVDGTMAIAAFKTQFGFTALPGEEAGDFQTLGGFVLDRLAHIPAPGEHFSWAGWRFEVVDMDRHRIDKVLLTPPAPPH